MNPLIAILISAMAAAPFARAGSPPAAPASLSDRAARFLELVNAAHQALITIEGQAQWTAATDVSPLHDAASETASRARAAFTGNPALIREARALLEHREQLDPPVVRQLERVLLNAAEGPMTRPELVAARIAAETRQASALNGFEFRLEGRPITPNEIDRLLHTSTNLDQRRAVWEASKQSGPALKPGLIELQKLRNGVARELGYPDYFSLQAAGYGMNAGEMLRLQEGFMRDLRPLYLHLHTWVKHELARRYGQPVPRLIPAHWLNNRWSQNWTGIVPAADFDPFFANRSAEWIVRRAEAFFTSLGFPALPATFWERSDLFPVPAGAGRRKNTHASCWHVDLDRDIRSLMNVEPDWRWFETAHHELGHGYYFWCYTRPEVPPLLRQGANPGFHEGIAELVSLASGSIPYLKSVDLLPKDFAADDTALLLNDALASSVPFIFWSSGTMTHWEADLYARELPPDQWNRRWWEYVRRFQGVEPPAARGEEFCDPATKTHINDTPAYYPAYAVATVLKFQLHEHIARRILRQPLHECNYAGHPEVAAFLRRIMDPGACRDWRDLLLEVTGEPLSTRAMLAYYQPLLAWLESENRGRAIGWEPDSAP
ncbi:MAG TPA: M2 family metallopeptidase [Candidatus Paceibacterota bacterium]|nr:M2 family metallopeptidase [Verrucomicrobiota bacterium]HRZ45324.1 M2 family metallopeptidase [Candidatus Paceibacterota bacterium]HRZ91533.1 M2 family metallopeptidase [Candidatus Paceibacterota bacterium]